MNSLLEENAKLETRIEELQRMVAHLSGRLDESRRGSAFIRDVTRVVSDGAVVIFGLRYAPAPDALPRPIEGQRLKFARYRDEPRFVFEIDSPTHDGQFQRQFWQRLE